MYWYCMCACVWRLSRLSLNSTTYDLAYMLNKAYIEMEKVGVNGKQRDALEKITKYPPNVESVFYTLFVLITESTEKQRPEIMEKSKIGWLPISVAKYICSCICFMNNVL